MLIIPAVDILDGMCVRLYQGQYDNVTRYSKDPAQIARQFQEEGAVRIHLVDLDAARGKGKHNRDTISRIRKEVSCTIEVGGGIRTKTDVDELVSIGIDKLVAGTVLAKEPDRVAGWIDVYGPRFIAGIDAWNGKVKISGWEKDAGMDDTVLARKASDIGISEIIYTSIAGDGALTGPDIERTTEVARAAGIPVILSGGIGSRDDVANVVESGEPGIIGIIMGKAIYEKKVSVADLVASFQR